MSACCCEASSAMTSFAARWGKRPDRQPWLEAFPSNKSCGVGAPHSMRLLLHDAASTVEYLCAPGGRQLAFWWYCCHAACAGYAATTCNQLMM